MPPQRVWDRTDLLGSSYTSFTGSEVGTKHYYPMVGENKSFLKGKEGNYLYNRLGFLPFELDVGHEMTLTGMTYQRGVLNVGDIWRGGPNNNRYQGDMAVANTVYQLIGESSPAGYMVEAYKKMKPTKPAMGLLNSLFELRELPGMIRGRFISSPLRTMSNVHLAYQFGWKPLLKDVISLIEIQVNAQKYLQQLLRDENRPVRRRIVVLDVPNVPYVTDYVSYGAVQPVLETQYYAYEPKVREVHRSMDKIWATATFKYMLPKGPRDIAYADRLLRRIKGGRMSPSVVYNAIPWTWLIDWFFNFGDVIENMEAGIADRLVANRFYGMRHVEQHVETHTTAGFRRKSGELVNFHGSSEYKRFSKARVQGDPFGWGTKQSQLSAMQLSILGALGISKLRL